MFIVVQTLSGKTLDTIRSRLLVDIVKEKVSLNYSREACNENKKRSSDGDPRPRAPTLLQLTESNCVA